MPNADHLNNGPRFGWCFRIQLQGIPGEYAATATFPSVGYEVCEVGYFGGSRKLAAKCTTNETTVGIRDYVSANVAASVYNWYRSVGNARDCTIANNYKRDGVIMATNTDGAGGVQYKIAGCFPSQVEFGEGDYSSTDLILINVTVTYDYAEM